MKKAIIILTILVTILSLNKEEKVEIPKDSIRFRVVANSNSEKDQTIKKKIVNNLKENILLLEYNNKSLKSSRNNIKKIIPKFSEVVDKTLTDEQENITYNINYGMNYFPEKEYKGTIYKEGKYESLVITLGNGQGNNFWCVLFPPLCLLDEEDETTNVEYTSLVKEIIDKYF